MTHLVQGTRRASGLVTAGLLAFALAACGSAGDSDTAGDGGELEQVTVRLDFVPKGVYAPLAYGIEKGIFEDAGFDLEIEPGTGSVISIESTSQGRQEFAFADSATTLQLAAKDAPDVTAVYAYEGRTDLAVCANADRGISSPEDLIGKSIAVTPTGPTFFFLPGALKGMGLNPDDVKQVHMEGPQRIGAIVSGKVDGEAGVCRDQDAPTLESQGINVQSFSYADHGIDPLGLVLLVNNDYAADNAEGVGEFLDAITASIEQAKEDRSAAVDALVGMFRETGMKGEVAAKQFDAFFDLQFTPNNEGEKTGWIAPEDWERSLTIAKTYLDVPENFTSEDAKAYMSNEYNQ